MRDLPENVRRALVALSCDDAEFGELFADEVGEDGQQQWFDRLDYMTQIWNTISDLVDLATMPMDSTRH